MNNKIYLDNNATTKIDEEVINAMLPYLTEKFGNPSSTYSFGKEIKEVFGEVSSKDYMDSILTDIEGAGEEILENPMYITLNLCRVLAYKKEGLILSKKEGGEWGLQHIAHPEYNALISEALKEYETCDIMTLYHEKWGKEQDYASNRKRTCS